MAGPEFPYEIGPLAGGDGQLPLAIEPRGEPDPNRLAAWLGERPSWVRERLALHGAILLRGFDVRDPTSFETLARAVDPDLKNEYLGTSPRGGLTDYVFSASELPAFYPIPQHCEMSFLPEPPRRVFFCCLEPSERGGETPLVDFRRVYESLEPEVRKRFDERGLRIVRNYSGPTGGGRLDPWKLKRWDEMFETRDRAEVESTCRAQGFDIEWSGDDRLRIVNTQAAHREHPLTGERVWHNHAAVFHLSAAPGEYRRIWRLRGETRIFFLWQLSRLLVAAQRRLRASDEQAMHCTFGDGQEISDADMERVRDAIWRHLVVFPWRRGDVVAIDNFAVAHGRLPYRGPRQVAVCWA